MRAPVYLLLVLGYLPLVFGADDPSITLGYREPANISEIRQKAAAGDPDAQVELGHNFFFLNNSSAALRAYLQAARQNHVKGAYEAGALLLFAGGQNVETDPAEGIRLTFFAATNRHQQAYLSMSRAYQYGVGVDQSLVNAYAWKRMITEPICSDCDAELKALAKTIGAEYVRKAEAVAAEYAAGHWPKVTTRPEPICDPRLRLTAVQKGSTGLVAIINRKSFREGQTKTIQFEDEGGKGQLTCLKLSPYWAQVKLKGEKDEKALPIDSAGQVEKKQAEKWARQMIEDAPRQQANYDAALAQATNFIPYAADFARLFPGSASYFSYYTGVVGPSRFVMESLLFSRYELTMIVPVTFDVTRRKVTTFGEPQLILREFEANPRRITGEERSPNFGLAEWKKLVEARGDLSALGFTILTNSPAPGFEEFSKNWEMRNTKQP